MLDLTLMIVGRVISGALRPGEKVRTAVGYCYCTLGQKRVVVTGQTISKKLFAEGWSENRVPEPNRKTIFPPKRSLGW
jgi:hypothetical protein